MALLVRGPIGEISGKLGGLEAARVGGRTVLKQAKTRQSSTSSSRVRAQSDHVAAIQFWKSLTDLQRMAWNQAAKDRPSKDRLGTLRCLNGFQLFMSLPHDWRFTFLPIWSYTPPQTQLPPPTNPIVEAVAPGHLEITIDEVGGFEAYFCYCHVARFRSASTRLSGFQWKTLPMVLSSFDSVATFDTAMAAENMSFVSGERIGLRVGFWIRDCWPVIADLGRIVVT
jgi:hypothetical protein